MARGALRRIILIALASSEPMRAGGEVGGRREDPRGDAYDEVGLVLVDDATMRVVNRSFRGLDRTTDVLAFDLRPARVPGEPRLGEVLISTDRVLVQARRYRVTAARELARLAVHGVLHLRGFDHQAAAERRRMRALERLVMGRIAVEIGRLGAGAA